MRPGRDEIIAGIYDAAVEPDGVARIAKLLRLYLDVDSVGLWFIENGQITDLWQTEDIVESVGPYLAYYHQLDPWIASRKTPGVAYLGSDTVDEADLVRTEFYQDFARHYGMLRPMGLVLGLDGGRLATLAMNRMSPSRLLGEADRAVVQDLAVHLRSALSLRSRHLAVLKRSEENAAVLNQPAFGVVLCSADGIVRQVNEAALEIARETSCFAEVAPGAQLLPRNLQEGAVLRALIAAAANGEPGAMRLKGLRGRGVSVLVSAAAQSGATDREAGAAVFLQSDDAAPGLDAGTLAKLFGLSPAQASLCVLLLKGLTFEEAATERNIATSTARSHFAAILERTGARNLRDLLRLLSALPSLRR